MSYSILVADPIDQKAQQMLVDAGFDVTAPGEPTMEEVTKLIPGFDVLVVRSRTKVNAKMIAAGKMLKVIGRAGVGVDTIDVATAEQRGIKVVNAPGSNSRSVAEHAIGLMFALARMIPQADASMKAGKWEKKQFKGIELEGKMLAVLGYGNVGRIVSNLAAGIGMKVIVWSRPVDKTDQYPFYEQLGEALVRADFVTVHVPKLTETENLLHRRVLVGMKEGVFLVNTARGGIVHEADLLDALNTGRVAGAALDVFENEPTPLPALITHPRVIVTPHVAALTKEAQQRAGVMMAEQIIQWVQGLKKQETNKTKNQV